MNIFKKYIRYRKRIKILESLGYRFSKGNLMMTKKHCLPIFKKDIKNMSDISFNQKIWFYSNSNNSTESLCIFI